MGGRTRKSVGGGEKWQKYDLADDIMPEWQQLQLPSKWARQTKIKSNEK